MKFRKITEEDSIYDNIENMPVTEILEDINREDMRVAEAVHICIPTINKLVEEIIKRMKKGGRVFYIGAGTSGRLGVLDSSEIPPTFGMKDNPFIGIIAGGDTALRNAVEKAEDNILQGWLDLKEHGINKEDTVIGIAASGITPYVIEAMKVAAENGILTASISSNPGAPLSKVSQIAIEVVVGPEFITGSSRMKSGTAQKMILNMISTAVMIKMGRIKGNKMVNMQLTNNKLIERGTKIIMNELSINKEEAEKLLLKYKSVKNALENYKK